jgi:spore maturation protein CgeB
MKLRQSQFHAGGAGLSQGINGNESATLELNAPLDAESLLSPPRSLLGNRLSQPNRRPLKIVILGPSITSSPGGGPVAPYRGLLRELSARGHDVLFLERGLEGNGPNRDLPKPASGRTERYSGLKELKGRFAGVIREADFVMVGSHINAGIETGEWVTRIAEGATAFYDVDAAQTMANLSNGHVDYISPTLIARYQIYLSSAGGPLLDYIEKRYGAPMARPFYCSVDARLHFPEQHEIEWDLGYAGDHRQDCQPTFNRLFIEPARQWDDGCFVVAGAQYPRSLQWPKNVKRVPRLSPGKRRAFYNSQRFSLNLTPPGAIAAGFSPNARLFEAAACGTPVISEFWPGLDTFFKPDDEILISHSRDETLIYLEEISELDRRRIAYRARERVLAGHTTRHRAVELENYALEVLKLSAA